MIVSAKPEELRTYSTNAWRGRTPIAEFLVTFHSRINTLAAALPEGFDLPETPNVNSLLGRVGPVDHHVSVVASRFENAGRDPDGDGVFELDNAVLSEIPFETPYTEEHRQRLREQIEEELATLRERLQAGDADETTANELYVVLDAMRGLIESSETPSAEAADLIDTMGSGDVHEALKLFEQQASGIDNLSRHSWPIEGIENLAIITSMGLENNPGRANRWAGELADRRNGFDEEGADAVALMAGLVGPGTSTLGTSLFNKLFDAESTPEGGLVDQVFDTNAPVEPVLQNAAGNPDLANGIVDDLLSTIDEEVDSDVEYDIADTGVTQTWRASRFDLLFGEFYEQPWAWSEDGRDSRFADIDGSLLRDVITSSVDPSLDDLDRGTTAQNLTEHFVDSQDGAPSVGFSGDVTEGFARATQPLLAGWQDGAGEVVLGEHTQGEVRISGDVLWDAIGQYGESDGGVNGLSYAIEGATEERLLDSAANASSQPDPDPQILPLVPEDLRGLADLYNKVDAVVGEEHLRPDVGDATLEVLEVVVGQVPGGGFVTGLEDAFSTYQEVDAPSPDPLQGLRHQTAAQLVFADLAGRPELDTPEVRASLAEAASEHGAGGIYDWVMNNPHDGSARAQLSTLVFDQLEIVRPEDAE